MLHNKLPPDSVSWQNSYVSSWVYSAGRFFWSWLEVSCGLGDSVLLHSSLILPVGPVGEARTVFLMAVAEGKSRQDQSWSICMPLLVSHLLTLHWPNQVTWLSRVRVGGLYKGTWRGSWAGYHFYKLPKETAMKMKTKAVLGLISWYLGNRKQNLFVQCSYCFFFLNFSLNGFYLEGGWTQKPLVGLNVK